MFVRSCVFACANMCESVCLCVRVLVNSRVCWLRDGVFVYL